MRSSTMNDLDIATSRAIHSQRHELSSAVVERQYALRPELRDRYGERGREKCVHDTEFHLAHLSAAILASSPALFADYIGWVGSVMASAGVLMEDVRENIACLQEVFDKHLPKEMASVTAIYVESALEQLAEPAAEASSNLLFGESYSGIARKYLQLVLACRRHDAGALIVNAVNSGLAIRDVYLEIFQPCQRELGRLWQAGKISPAQEHYCTATTQLIMSQLAPRLFTTGRNGRKAVIACVAGESHEVGTRMVADLLELAGWDTIYLGGSVPVRGVVQVLVEHGGDLLAASATMAYHLPAVIELITAVRTEPACAGVKIMVGGRLFDAEPGLWQRIGADGHVTNADEACQLADRLFYQRDQGSEKVDQRVLETIRELVPPALPWMTDDLYDELGRVNSEVVALNRELVRKNAEVERLHAEVSRHALDLAEADNRKNEFLAMLGHELRNPLAPLRNALALLGPEDPDPETVRWARDLMNRQVRQMVRLVDDLFDMSRIMQGKLELRTEWVKLATVVADAVETARPIIDAKGHELTLSLPANPVVLEVDPIRLTQVLTNLLTNASKYTKPNGQITLTVRSEGAEVRISVKDNGVGIARDMQPRVFDLFMQENGSADRSQGGLGVGLAMVKSLVELHGGTVQVRSEGLDRGSEFLVLLPAPARGALAQSPGGGKPTEAKWPHRRILVVDDNEDSANVLGKVLRRLYGQEVEVAYDGATALALLETFRPDVVLLDIGLPNIDGYEVARQLRKIPGFETVPLFALTGRANVEDRRKSQEAGFHEHLVKPVDPEALLELVARV
jgi:signal transduction histidine kinase